jgi:hypothetical protein
LRRAEPSRAIIAAVIPQALIAIGIVALAAGLGVLASFGTGLRIGRLLAVTKRVPIADALAAARDPRPTYLRIDGRIDSETSFEDAAHRPLVLRRTRVSVRDGRRWRVVEDGREAVPFELNEGLDTIALDDAALAEGLVVIPRLSTGVAADVPDRVPAGTPTQRAVRIQVDQVSAVEHATVLGVPVIRDGRPTMTAGAGRPLVLTTLEIPEAMRLLSGGRRTRAVAVAALVATGAVLVVAGFALALLGPLAPVAAGASPTPATGGGDTRSAGQGPGFVGQPLLAIGGVVLIAVIAVAATLAYVRLTTPRSTDPAQSGAGDRRTHR